VKDGSNRVREAFVYDEVGNVTRVTRGTGKVVERDFDAAGNVVEERDLSVSPPRVVRRRFDELGRVVWTQGPAPGLPVETFDYDDLDRLVFRTDAVGGMDRFVYDEDGFLVQHVQRSGGASGSPLVVNYDYDERGLLAGIRDPEAGRFLFEADALGRLVRRAGPGGAEWRASYTPLGDLAKVETALGAVVETTQYTAHDARGYPLGILTSESATPTAIEYTALGRVKKVTYPDASSEEFGYDRAGNRRTAVDGTGSRTYHYDAADQLVEIRAGLTGPVLESFGHDDAGRRSSHTKAGATTTYGYDGYGRLASVTRTGYSASLTYAPSGRRFERAEGASVARYPTPRYEERSGGRFRLLRSTPFGAVVAEVQTPATGPQVVHALHRDGSANVTLVARTTGTTTTFDTPPRRWTAFGTVRSGSSILERGYASQAQEGATGLVLMGARHYDPATGRFLQPDPLGIAASELYAYAANNPYVFWDPTGLKPISLSTSGALPTALGLGAGITVGGSATAACFASAVCGVAATVAGVAALAYDATQGFRGVRGFLDDVGRTSAGGATFSQAFNVGFAVGGAAGGLLEANAARLGAQTVSAQLEAAFACSCAVVLWTVTARCSGKADSWEDCRRHRTLANLD